MSTQTLLEVNQPKPVSTIISREQWQQNMALCNNIGSAALSNLIEPLTFRNIDDEEIAYDALGEVLRELEADSDDLHPLRYHIETINSSAQKPLESDDNQLIERETASFFDSRPLVLADPLVQETVNARDCSDNHRGLVETWPSFKESLTIGVRSGISQGYIPAAAGDRLDPALKYTSVRIVDTALIDTITPMSNAYYRNDRDEIGLKAQESTINQQYEGPLIHEFVHKLSGGTFIINDRMPSIHNRPRVGFSTELKPYTYTHVGLSEAVTEHLAMSITNGDFGIFDPDLRKDDELVYYNYRKILATFTERSGGVIDVKTLTNALFEDTEPGSHPTNRKELAKQFYSAYGPGALRKLDELLTASDLVGKAKLNEFILQRIKPPIVNADGVVITKGYLDTENLPSFENLFKDENTQRPST